MLFQNKNTTLRKSRKIFLLAIFFLFIICSKNLLAQPDSITNLTALPGSIEGEIDLQWTYPGPQDLPSGEKYAIQGSSFIVNWSTSSAQIFIPAGAPSPGDPHSFTVTGLTNGTTYFFRVWTSSDSLSQWSEISNGATNWAQIDEIAPGKITNLSAFPGFKHVTLNWTAPGDNGTQGNIVDGRYEIRCSTVDSISDDTEWNNVPPGYPYRISWSTDTFPFSSESRIITGLENNVTYYFAIKTRDEVTDNWSVLNDTSPARLGIPVNTPPSSFSLTSPGDGNEVDTQKPVFDWSDSDPGADDGSYGDWVKYEIRYSTVQNFAVYNSSDNLLSSDFTPPHDLIENAVYWWNVRAKDSEGFQTFSDTWTVAINSVDEYPTSFSLSTPTYAQVVSTTNPFLDWEDSSDPDPGDTISYTLKYSSNSNFSPCKTIQGLSYSSYTVTEDLVENKLYYWEVTVIDSDGLGRKSNQTDWYFGINTVDENPGGFSLLGPSDSQTVSDSRPDFDWEDSIDPDPGDTVTYNLFYSTYSDYTSSTVIKGISASSYTLTGDLADDSTYYWKVEALDSDGLKSQSSEQNWKIFTYYEEPPDGFSLLSPSQGEIVNTKTPSFDWEDASDPDPGDWIASYTLRYSTNQDFSTYISSAGITVSSYTPTAELIENATYYWSVIAFDSTGLYTLSDSTRTFRVNSENTAPASFNLISSSGVVDSLRPKFDWEDSFDVDPGDYLTYTIWYSTVDNYSVYSSSESLQDSEFTPATSLEENTTYWWKVKALDGSTETWSNQTDWYIIVDTANQNPLPFGLIEPTNGFEVNILTPTLRWDNTSDPDPFDSFTFTLRYSQHQDFSTYTDETNITTTSYTFSSNLSDDATYYWKIKAEDTNGGITWSNETDWKFITNYDDPPTGFELISPSDTETADLTPTFDWQDSTDPDPKDSVSYTLWYSTDASFNVKTISSGITSSQFTPSGNLDDNSTYWWKVKAEDQSGDEVWSESTFKFWTNVSNDPPSPFGLIYPADEDTITNLSPLFDWQDSSDVDPNDTITYTIEYSTLSDFSLKISSQNLNQSSFTPSTDLIDNTTYYWRVKAIDNHIAVTTSTQTNWKFWTNVTNDPPAAFDLLSPADNTETSDQTPEFSWSASYDIDPNDSITYTLWYSTSSSFQPKTTVSGLDSEAYTPPQKLNENTSYFWKVKAVDLNSGETWSNQTDWKIYIRLLNIPKSVRGLKGELNTRDEEFQLSWNPVEYNTDGTSISDLQGYNIYRESYIQDLGENPPIKTVSSGTNQWTDTSFNNKDYYYIVRAVDDSGIESKDSLIVDSSSDENVIVMSSDKQAMAVIPKQVKDELYEENNSIGEDLDISLERKSSEEKQDVLRSWELKVIKTSDNTQISDFSFESPIIEISFSYSNDYDVVSVFNRPESMFVSQSQDQVGVFWHNGVEYVRIGGETDSAKNIIKFNTKYPGKYQVQSIQRATEFELTQIWPSKVFTPNADNINDEIHFMFENPKKSVVSGEIFDITGAYVSDMQQGTGVGSSLTWDGKTNSGDIADKGVYIYQIKAEEKIINGTIILAK